MDIFVRNVPHQATNRSLDRLFRDAFAECGIKNYHVEKMRNKPLAIITVLEISGGHYFLQQYGVPQGLPAHVRGQKPLIWDGKSIQCSLSKNQPSPEDTSIRTLAYEATQRAQSHGPPQPHNPASGKKTKRFAISALQCGVYDYAGARLAFQPHYSTTTSGSITFGHKEAIILLGNQTAEHTRIDMNYFNCENVVLGDFDGPSITIALSAVAPKFYTVSGEDVLSAQLTALMIGNAAAKAKDVRKTRMTSIDSAHGKIAGACFIYRLQLTDSRSLSSVRSLLQGAPKTPSTISMSTAVIYPQETWARSKERLNHELTDITRSGSKPFRLRFQPDRLARNGSLPPLRVLHLLPHIDVLYSTYGLDATLFALGRFYREVPVAGPDTPASDFTLEALKKQLNDLAASYDQHAPDNPYELAKRHTHVSLVHKIVVTPAGTYLEGPEPEPTNRVLREYASQTDNFTRVVLQDEDGSNVHYDARASNDIIFHQRFKGVLDGAITIAGHAFTFLGFSHSSLRSQSCWFMAPLLDRHTKTLFLAPQIIKRLGDFSNIRTPAKCAARIGQCFTDTSASVTLDEWEIGTLAVVERNGRDFSDGVGTISRALLQDVWRVHGSRRLLKPTILQIRFRGAKGVVSLDSRLRGRQLLLRSNMRKFEGSANKVLEICGAAFKPLPMVLNRQFIKILEDLGVQTHVFMQLQKEEVDRLRCMLTSAINTASLLETLEIPKATRIPDLIKLLDEIGLDYRTDLFLYRVIEIAVVNHLRDIKYRGRIPVEQGVTLYGIMDETGFLKEGEIYIATEAGPEGGRRDEARSNIIVTRSPAMHPGDIQIVDAVKVPDNSPLKQLSNCVVFSQHGARDLPSQLSGGDLDGDLYNVVWDRRLVPSRYCTPADYPRVAPRELDRAVTAKDMSDFFVTFMETDTLGMLCNIHMQLADQQPAGTFSAECIKLAGMASTAVDYSKTGIPVSMKDCPRYDRCRPDFMAPSPRVMVSEKGYLDFEDEDNAEDEALEGFDTERRPIRYYESQKALGHLYRAIDERKFIANLQRQHEALRTGQSSPQLSRVLTYMMKWAAESGLMYRHHEELARDVRACYEESLLNIMYNYCPASNSALSEAEVFAGSILGRQGGAQGKPLRELSQTMRQRFETVVEYTEKCIIHGTETVREAGDVDEMRDDRIFEALPRAIACLSLAVKEPGWNDRLTGELKSFGYIAAGVCLREWGRWRINTYGSYTLPRV